MAFAVDSAGLTAQCTGRAQMRRAPVTADVRSRMTYSHAWSWNTAIAVVVAGALYWLLRLLMKRRYSKEYEDISGDAAALERQPPSFWNRHSFNRKAESFDRAFNWWLVTFGFIRSREPALIALCLAVQIAWVVAVYFVFAEPIYFESRQ